MEPQLRCQLLPVTGQKQLSSMVNRYCVRMIYGESIQRDWEGQQGHICLSTEGLLTHIIKKTFPYVGKPRLLASIRSDSRPVFNSG